MYLKELTLRGFKSFANPTTLRFEPGITAVVGPNGSGKSNIVDALAWVMGEQGAKALRGQSMEDVIFAGTASRPAMGRAQVTLTIDNSDHALDIDYDEVTISRVLYRNGGSEYAINGSPVRLLDVQDLLSDAGLGQQMHVIVGQGQLSRILNSDPQGHRAIIEEAAGILKHRKRKQRSLRRLSAAKANLDRLDDLLGEIDRQMRPLARQAKAARRSDAVRAVARDARARLLADDVSGLLAARRSTSDKLARTRADLSSRRGDLARIKVSIENIENEAAGGNPALARLSDALHGLTLLDGRYESLAALAGERSRAAADDLSQLDSHPVSDPDILSSRAQELSRELAAEKKRAAAVEQRRQAGTQARADAESHLASLRQTISQLRQARQDHESQVSRLEQLLASQKASISGFDQRLSDAQRHSADVSGRLKENQQEVARLEEGQRGEDAGLSASIDHERETLSDLSDALEKARNQRTDLDNSRIRLVARADALGDTIRSRHEGSALASATDVHPLGSLSELVSVASGWEEALASALSVFSDALVLADPDQIPAALAAARDHRAERTAVLAPLPQKPSGDSPARIRSSASSSRADSSAGASSADADFSALAQRLASGEVIAAASLVGPIDADDPKTRGLSERVVRSLRALLSGTGIAQEAQAAFDACRAAASRDSDSPAWRRVVTRAGEIVTPAAAVTVALGSPSDLALVARRKEALKQAADLQERIADADREIEDLSRRQKASREKLAVLSKQRDEARLAASRIEAALSIRNKQIASDEKELDDIAESVRRLRQQKREAQARQSQLSQTLEKTRSDSSGQASEEDLAQREQAAEKALSDAREKEVQARLDADEAQRHVRSLDRQIGLLTDEAQQAGKAKEQRAERRTQILARRDAASDLVARVAAVRRLLAACIRQTNAKHEAASREADRHQQQLTRLRHERDALEPEVSRLEDSEHRLDLDHERQAVQMGQLQQQASSETGLAFEELVRRYGPDNPVARLDESGNPDPAGGTTPYVRKEQQERLEKAEKQIARLGKVNPLAGAQYEALQERQKYLTSQRDDVASSRKQLLGLVDHLDSTMEEVFSSAFRDISGAYSRLFADLFPGGRGRLRLDDPEHPLTSGVVVEASPAGKKVRELSLLSGGEKSLSALALLLAISQARPSPFYVMDEVEAALDDLNLTRLLRALRKMRESSQLIIITHQQRTMAIADALYGVSMRADGVTAVLSQKMSDLPASAFRDDH